MVTLKTTILYFRLFFLTIFEKSLLITFFFFSLHTDESKLNSSSWDNSLPALEINSSELSPLGDSNNSSTTTTTTAQLHHNAANTSLHRSDQLNSSRSSFNSLQTLLNSNTLAAPLQQYQQQQQQQLHHHHHQHSKSCGSASTVGRPINNEAENSATASVVNTNNTIAGGSISTNGGSAAVGVSNATATTTTDTVNHSQTAATANSHATKKRLEHNVSTRSVQSEDSWCSEQSVDQEANANSIHTASDEEAATEDERERERERSSVTSLSATNQRNSQLRSTLNKAKQHLSFDKWRTSSSNSGNAANNTSTSSATNSVLAGNNSATDSNSHSTQTRRASACTMPTAHQSARDDITTPGESPGGRLSRWFSIRRGSSHQYDVGGRDGRHSTASSIDMPDAAALSACGDSTHASPQKLSANKMPGVPEVSRQQTKSFVANN